MKKIAFKLVTLLSLFSILAQAKEITLEEVRTLYPFGKTDNDIEVTIKTLKSNNKSVKEALNEYFEQNDKDILANLQTYFPTLNLNFDELDAFKQQNYNQNPLFTTEPTIINNPADHPLVQRSREIIASLGMNPEHVKIGTKNKEEYLPYIASVASSASLFLAKTNTYANILFLNLKICQELTNNEFDAVIAHECMHLWYADSIITQYIIQQIKPMIWNSPETYSQSDRDYFNAFKNLISNNHEMRADIMSALHNEEYRKGLYAFFMKSVAAVGTDSDPAHPTDQERVDAILQLNSYLEKEQNQGSAI